MKRRGYIVNLSVNQSDPGFDRLDLRIRLGRRIFVSIIQLHVLGRVLNLLFEVLLPLFCGHKIARITIDEVLLIALPRPLPDDLIIKRPHESHDQQERGYQQRAAHRVVCNRVEFRSLWGSFF